MDQQTTSYRIRLARRDEVPRLRKIEDQAGTLFSGPGLIDEALDVSFPLDELARLEDGLPVGMVIASAREGPPTWRRWRSCQPMAGVGSGGRLLAWVCAWAQAQSHATVTLSIFRDVPWNGPFYSRHGFRELQPAEWTPGMRAIREQEAQHGLRVEARVFMRRVLGQVGPPPRRGGRR